MNPRPHISVVIPVYNEETMVRECLEAISNQSRLADVIYIVDNNSTDTSIDIAKHYASVEIVSESKQGICAATKKGLDTAVHHNGIILRCDADCRPDSDWIERIERTFVEHPEARATTGPGAAYDVSCFGKILFNLTYMRPYFFFVGLALKHPPLFGSNFAVRASAWKAISNHTHLLERQDIHDDIDISYHLGRKIIYDSSLIVPISARPFKSLGKMVKRYKAGFRSIFIHWPQDAPWRR